jgi:hypothetical protein
MFKYLLMFLILGSSLASAQSLSVTATITDTDGQTWNNGTFSVQIFSPNGTPYYNGTPVSRALQMGSMNGSGVLSVTLNNTSTITPSGALYTWTICPQASVKCSTFNTQVITTNLSTLLSSLVTTPRFAAGYSNYGYLDAEITPTPTAGLTYYNVTSGLLRYYNGSTWSPLTPGGAGVYAPLTNPPSGQNNYAPIDNPIFTTQITVPVGSSTTPGIWFGANKGFFYSGSVIQVAGPLSINGNLFATTGTAAFQGGCGFSTTGLNSCPIGSTTQSTGGFTILSVGSSAATTGIIRIPSAQTIYARKAAGTSDFAVIGTDASDRTVVGDSTNLTTSYLSGNGHFFYVNGVGVASLNGTIFSLGNTSGCSNPFCVTLSTGAVQAGNVTSTAFVKTNTSFQVTEGTAIASASTITPVTSLFDITGSTGISVMTPLSGYTTTVGPGTGGCVNFTTDNAIVFSAGTSVGSFKLGFTSVANTLYTKCYRPSTGLWY